MNDADLTLLQRYREDRDEQAFAQIVRRYAGMVLGACWRVLGDRSRAEDATQETFFKLMRKPESVNSTLAGWLHCAATHLAIDMVRSDASRLQREATFVRQQARDVSRWEEVSPYVDEALDELAKSDRAILIQHFLQGVPQTELARRLGVSAPTMSRRMKAALAALRRKLADKGVVVGAAVLATWLSTHATQAATPVLLAELGRITMISATTKTLAPSGGALWAAASAPVHLTFCIACAAAVILALTGLVINNQACALPGPSDNDRPPHHEHQGSDHN